MEVGDLWAVHDDYHECGDDIDHTHERNAEHCHLRNALDATESHRTDCHHDDEAADPRRNPHLLHAFCNGVGLDHIAYAERRKREIAASSG